MVNNCSICSGNFITIQKVPKSARGNTVCVCERCGIIQSVESSTYDPTQDPHSLRYLGERHVSASDGAMWGNIRHGKGLRLDAHKDLLNRIFEERSPKIVFDDGANRGHFARFVSRLPGNVKYFGCEPDPICFESYQNNTPEIYNSYTEKFDLPGNIDFIYSAHTLEHVDSVFEHLEILCNKLTFGGTLFLDLPNSQQIIFEQRIFEEYFVEKHKSNFMISDLISILTLSGLGIDFVTADPFNMTIVATKTSEFNGDLANLKVEQSLVEKRISDVQNYFKKSKESKEAFEIICAKINEFKFNKSVVFYGGGRLLLGFLAMGLTEFSVSTVIDNYLFDKTKKCGGLELFNDEILENIDRKTPIILFARSSAPKIKESLKDKGFLSVKIFDEFIK